MLTAFLPLPTVLAVLVVPVVMVVLPFLSGTEFTPGCISPDDVVFVKTVVSLVISTPFSLKVIGLLTAPSHKSELLVATKVVPSVEKNPVLVSDERVLVFAMASIDEVETMAVQSVPRPALSARV